MLHVSQVARRGVERQVMARGLSDGPIELSVQTDLLTARGAAEVSEGTALGAGGHEVSSSIRFEMAVIPKEVSELTEQ
jgi:hypothetical protein